MREEGEEVGRSERSWGSGGRRGCGEKRERMGEEKGWEKEGRGGGERMGEEVGERMGEEKGRGWERRRSGRKKGEEVGREGEGSR